MKLQTLATMLILGTQLAATNAAFADKKDQKLIDRGRYLVSTSLCNDCHTPGYAQREGNMPASEWLTGNAVGFQGPWGTTYPSNLRLLMQSMTQEQWLAHARSPRRPPMPWFSLREMSDADLIAIYQFVRDLGPKGEMAPNYAPPGATVHTPYIEFIPKNLPTHASANN